MKTQLNSGMVTSTSTNQSQKAWSLPPKVFSVMAHDYLRSVFTDLNLKHNEFLHSLQFLSCS